LILSKIKNQKIYYSCNAKNRVNTHCNISLVDTPNRVERGKNCKLWVKGKDPEFWKPVTEKKEFDYLLIGQRGDKNERYFLEKLNIVEEKRRILWIGGKKHESRIKSNHDITYTNFLPKDQVRDNISRAKVGILFTELKIEGFPQSFVEMAMCGVPVVYNIHGPTNEFYFHDGNHILCPKGSIIKNAEKLLRNYNAEKCRQVTIENCSLDKSYQRILKCLK
jgi:glycosyltransferase involved in cell wall biosynthesis